MVSCYYCVFHKSKGAAHTCDHCQNKVVYGEIQEKFLEPCLYFKITLRERINRQRRQANAPFIDEKRRLKKSEVKKDSKGTKQEITRETTCTIY